MLVQKEQVAYIFCSEVTLVAHTFFRHAPKAHELYALTCFLHAISFITCCFRDAAL